jgi:hypothetical protein
VVAIALAIAAPVLLLPSTLNLAFPVENPSPTRLATAVPVVFMLAGLPFGHLWGAAASVPHRLRPAAAGIGAGLAATALAVAAQQSYGRYFHDFRTQYDLSAPTTNEVVRAVRSAGFGATRTYLFGYAYWVDPRNVGFELRSAEWGYTNQLTAESALPSPTGGPLLFVLNGHDAASLARLKAAMPGGSTTVVHSRIPGKDFVLFRSPG